MLRRDLQLAIENAQQRLDGLPSDTLCVFTHHVPMIGSGPPPLKLRKIVDLAPITITDQVTYLFIKREMQVRHTIIDAIHYFSLFCFEAILENDTYYSSIV